MKFLIGIILALSSLVSANYEIKHIEDIEGTIKQIEFDSHSNTYIKTGYNNETDRFYKLDQNNVVRISVDYFYLGEILINPYDEVYIFSRDHEDRYWNVEILRLGSNEIQFLFKFIGDKYGMNIYMDSEGNLYYNTNKGVAFLRRGQSLQLRISNLESYAFNRYGEDLEGNVYLGTGMWSYGKDVNVITKEEKNKPVPYAKTISEINGTGTFYEPFSRGYNPNVFAFVLAPDTNPTIWKFEKDSAHQVLSLYTGYCSDLYGTRDRFFVSCADWTDIDAIKYFLVLITADEKITKIEPSLESIEMVSDKNGNVFSRGSSAVLTVKHNETSVRSISMPDGQSVVSIDVDDYNNVWVLGKNGLFVILENTDSMSEVAKSQWTKSLSLKVKKTNNDVFLVTESGLFLCTYSID